MIRILVVSFSVIAMNCNGTNDWDRLAQKAYVALVEKQETLKSEYNLGQHERFDVDQEKGTLVFSNDGKPTVIAKVQYVGSVSTISNTWLWSWANPTILEKVKDQMHIVKEYGLAHKYRAITEDKWPADEADGWEMTYVTDYLLKTKGAYRIEEKTGYTYMVITDIQWVKD